MTDSVSEALLLEINLVKRYRPRYNVRLKDDKSYPFIKITLAEDFPRVERTRKLPADGSRYFGPYASASSVDEAMNLIRRLFPFRTCTLDIHEGRKAIERPCLLYHIKRCQAPCVGYISQGRLPGRHRADRALPRRPPGGRGPRADAPDAGGVRGDRIRAGGRPARQGPGHRADDGEPEDGRPRHDRGGRAGAGPPGHPGRGPALRRPRREDGRARRVPARRPARDRTTPTVLAGFVQQYYARATSRPAGRARARAPRRRGGSRGVPRRRGGERPSTSTSRGAARSASCWSWPPATPRRRWRASTPAGWPTRARRWPRSRSWPTRSACRPRRSASSATTSATSRARSRSAAWSCSRRAGRGPASTAASGSRTVAGANDFASHQEVLRRRFTRAKAGEEGSEEELRWRLPDLVVIDGGKGQLSAAKEVLDELGYHDLAVVGLAKEREEIFLPERDEPVLLPTTSPALYLMQRLRDEAHRFAITYHRALRARAATHSRLRRPAGRGPQAPARAAAGLRLGEAGARGAGRAGRGRSGNRRRAGRQDQGRPGGVGGSAGRARRSRRRDAARRTPPGPPCYHPASCEDSSPS